jgi:predicted protein tyrosine phosphatase
MNLRQLIQEETTKVFENDQKSILPSEILSAVSDIHERADMVLVHCEKGDKKSTAKALEQLSEACRQFQKLEQDVFLRLK